MVMIPEVLLIFLHGFLGLRVVHLLVVQVLLLEAKETSEAIKSTSTTARAFRTLRRARCPGLEGWLVRGRLGQRVVGITAYTSCGFG